MKLPRLAGPLALALACAACPNPFGSAAGSMPPEFRQNLALWQRHGLQDYRYVLSAGKCECLPAWVRPAHVVVSGGATTHLAYVDDGSTDVWATYRRLDRVEDLFAFVDDAYDRNADVLEVEYHPQYGFPVRIFVDRRRNVGDDEIEIRVEQFTPIGRLQAGG